MLKNLPHSCTHPEYDEDCEVWDGGHEGAARREDQHAHAQQDWTGHPKEVYNMSHNKPRRGGYFRRLKHLY